MKGYTNAHGNITPVENVIVNVSAEEGEVSGYEVSIITNVVGTTNKYIPIEYIEATGSQYTDTGFIPTVNTKLISELEVPTGIGNKNIFCASTNFVLNSKSDNQLEYKLYNVIGYTHVTTPSPITSRFKVEYSPQTLKFNDEVIASPNASSLSNSNTMWLFSREGGSSTYYGYGKIYYLKLYESGELVRDYIPVKSLDGKIGLYDKINDTFISSNSGTEFVGGNVLGTIMTQTTPSASYKIPYGTSYMVKASDISGYTTPAIQSFTADKSVRDLELMYKIAPMGVYIVDKIGNLIDVDSWEGTDYTGVYIGTDNVKVIVASEEWVSTDGENPWNGNQRSAWGGYGTESNELPPYVASDIVRDMDFNGKDNTDKIINALSGTTDGQSQYYTGAPAAEYCRAYSKGCKGVGSWHLPSTGEFAEVMLNYDAVNTAFSKIGGEFTVKQSSWKWYWTSTNNSAYYAYLEELRKDYFHNITHSNVSKDKNRGYLVRPFAKY